MKPLKELAFHLHLQGSGFGVQRLLLTGLIGLIRFKGPYRAYRAYRVYSIGRIGFIGLIG